MLKTLICFIVIFMILPLTAQVKIKEKVEIKPEDVSELVETSAAGGGATLSVTMPFYGRVITKINSITGFESFNSVIGMDIYKRDYCPCEIEPGGRCGAFGYDAHSRVKVEAGTFVSITLTKCKTFDSYSEQVTNTEKTKRYYLYSGNTRIGEIYLNRTTDIPCEIGTAVVKAEKDTLTAGETTELIPYFRLTEGYAHSKLVKFHPDQEFEISSNFMLEDKDGNRNYELKDVTMPVKVIVPEDTSGYNRQVYVTIKVNKDKIISQIENPVFFPAEESPEYSRSLNKANLFDLPSFYANEIEGCYYLPVKPKNDCIDLPVCSGSNIADIQVEPVTYRTRKPLITGGYSTDICSDPNKPINATGTSSGYEYGGVKMANNVWSEVFDVKPCVNGNEVNLRLVNPGTDENATIPFEFVWDVCPDNNFAIKDIEDFKSKIDKIDKELLFESLCGQLCYPVTRYQYDNYDGIIFEELVQLHELKHRDQFLKFFNELKKEYFTDKINAKIKEYNLICESDLDAGTMNKLRIDFNEIINDYFKMVINETQKLAGTIENERGFNDSYEMKRKIDEYMGELKYNPYWWLTWLPDWILKTDDYTVEDCPICSYPKN